MGNPEKLFAATCEPFGIDWSHREGSRSNFGFARIHQYSSVFYLFLKSDGFGEGTRLQSIVFKLSPPQAII